MNLIPARFAKIFSRQTSTVSEETKEHWNNQGFVLFRDSVDEELIDKLNRDVETFRASCGETKDEFGYGQRIGLFHIQNQTSLTIALNPRVREFLKWAFNDEPVLFGSLTFEAGTQQAAHIDSIFFYTEPIHCMAGVWTALEDVSVDAGPLFYIPGSHKWDFIRGQDVWKAKPELGEEILKRRAEGIPPHELTDLAAKTSAAWHELLQKKIAREGKPMTPVVIKKGDVLIWHAKLVHGGLPRQLRKLSRRSMVVHYIAKNAPMWDMFTFFALKNREFKLKNALRFRVLDSGMGPHIFHEKPVTY